MAQKKKLRMLTAKVELNITASQIREAVDKSEVRSRGPRQIGQMKSKNVIMVNSIEQGELVRRIGLAKEILETGKIKLEFTKVYGKKEDDRKDTTAKKPVQKNPKSKNTSSTKKRPNK